MGIIHQLGELFLEAVPTVIIVFLFYLFMRWAFFTPIQKAMDERTARTEGARAEAARAEAEAKKEQDAYNDAVRKARGEIFAEQEAARQAVLDERQRLLKAMRSRAQEDVTAAKKKIDAEREAALAELEQTVPALAGEIAQMILEGPAVPPGGWPR
ncbi:MAG TPA: ATP synthase F0 subunit B [Candidatus Acidoferrum sp.]|jgi:F-type H+-transporting ATPase subunit b|nr:ATP synthase F0 subunit B [Candidatus Acidoferrum sp.]